MPIDDRMPGEEFARVAGIAVRCGERTDDPRLDPIDLRGTVRAVTLTVVDGRGEAVRARIRVEGESMRAARITDRDGRAVLLGRSLPLRVEVSSLSDPDHGGPGPARSKFIDVAADDVVVLDD